MYWAVTSLFSITGIQAVPNLKTTTCSVFLRKCIQRVYLQKLFYNQPTKYFELSIMNYSRNKGFVLLRTSFLLVIKKRQVKDLSKKKEWWVPSNMQTNSGKRPRILCATATRSDVMVGLPSCWYAKWPQTGCSAYTMLGCLPLLASCQLSPATAIRNLVSLFPFEIDHLWLN